MAQEDQALRVAAVHMYRYAKVVKYSEGAKYFKKNLNMAARKGDSGRFSRGRWKETAKPATCISGLGCILGRARERYGGIGRNREG